MNAEQQRLEEDEQRSVNWKRWGPYLPDRQWGTVREDYSPDGTCWDYFPHDHARSRAYRWGEDGLLGFTDRQCRLCLAPALWNHADPILKERLFGLTGNEGSNGEDVKECYYFLEATPTSSYCKALYKYPQRAFPYHQLLEENQRRNREEGEFELEDSGVFDDNRYFDVEVRYAKAGPDSIYMRLTAYNRGAESAPLTMLPQAWFRNTWVWGCGHEGCGLKPRLEQVGSNWVRGTHESLGPIALQARSRGKVLPTIFCENETNSEKLFGEQSYTPHTKDAFHRALIDGDKGACSSTPRGTKVAWLYQGDIPANESVEIELVLHLEEFGADALTEQELDQHWNQFDQVFGDRQGECDDFYHSIITDPPDSDQHLIQRQAYAGLLWSKKFYHIIIEDWLDGDAHQPIPPASRLEGRNHDWRHLYNRDIISLPDAWEYPWYAAWDSAFHMIPMARIDPAFAKDQLILFLREWYMHPNGQIPAYEFAFDDVNPPVHAWSCWQVYLRTGRKDRTFLARCFQKLSLNFTWWINRKDPDGHNLFAGGFLGLDNIGIFDRSKPLPGGGQLRQADGTAWMGFFCAHMLTIALELAMDDGQGNPDPAYGDMASKYFEHFIAIIDALNNAGGDGLWNEEDGFYYDQLVRDHEITAMRSRSLVGLMPLIAFALFHEEDLQRVPGFYQRLKWFEQYKPKLASYIQRRPDKAGRTVMMLSAVPAERLSRMLNYLVDEDEFLAPHGLRSLSKVHAEEPFSMTFTTENGNEHLSVPYTPGESDTWLFGGNSNWRGPIWFPTAYLMIESLYRYQEFYGHDLMPTRSSNNDQDVGDIAQDLAQRMVSLFEADDNGQRPVFDGQPRYADDPHWNKLVLFYEYFHGDTGRGCGASHQTGWTALVASCYDFIKHDKVSQRSVQPL